MDQKIILIHGNGGATGKDHWFPWLTKELSDRGFNVLAPDFPDAQLARSSIWLPFIKKLGANEQTILVGHSSGAVPSTRYCETHKILGSVLIGADYSDLGDETEKASGYYDSPWGWSAIKKNQQWIIQFASTDDPYIPISQPRFIHKKLDTDYHEFTNRGHFMIPQFPELRDTLLSKLSS